MTATPTYNLIAKHILAPVMDYSRGTRTMKYLRELEASQWWSRDKLLELQNQRLQQLIKHAYDNVPYYRRIFDERSLKPSDLGCSKDLVKLPLLTKKLIRAHSREIIARDFPLKETIELSTGGSTGEPLAFYNTKNSQFGWGAAATQRALGWTGYELGDKIIWLMVRRPCESTIVKLREDCLRFCQRIMLLDAAKMSVNTLPLFVKKLDSFQPKFILGYSNAIELIARFIEKERGHKIRPKAIITSAEQSYGYQQELFCKVFECEVYSYYSSWEARAIATDCAEHSGYHIAVENLIVEIVDEKGAPVPTGEEGRIVITNLHNYAMPFIRYDIGDLGVGTDNVCSCGRGLPLLAKINGRTADVIFTRNGKTVPGTVLIHVFRAPLGVAQFQIVQESYDKLVIKLVMDREYPKNYLDDLTRKLIDECKLILGEDMNIAVEFVDWIPRTEIGKLRVVISNLPAISEPGSDLV